jgi:hypothetical protein
LVNLIHEPNFIYLQVFMKYTLFIYSCIVQLIDIENYIKKKKFIGIVTFFSIYGQWAIIYSQFQPWIIFHWCNMIHCWHLYEILFDSCCQIYFKNNNFPFHLSFPPFLCPFPHFYSLPNFPIILLPFPYFFPSLFQSDPHYVLFMFSICHLKYNHSFHTIWNIIIYPCYIPHVCHIFQYFQIDNVMKWQIAYAFSNPNWWVKEGR